MALIKEPIACQDVRWVGDPIWCGCQAFWMKAPEKYLTASPEGILICAAHLNEGRAFTCGFTGPDDEHIEECRDYAASTGRDKRILHAAD